MLICVIGFFVLLQAISLVRTAEQSYRDTPRTLPPTRIDLKMIGLAFHNYHDTYGQFPSAAIYNKEGHPLFSWRVSLLPFLDERELYSQFHLDEPWDSPNNLPLLAKIPKVYLPKTGRPGNEPYGTYYQVFVGPGAAFEDNLTITFASLKDGTSQTILAIEAEDAVPWTAPEDLPFTPGQPLPKIGGHSKYGCYAVFADGSIHFIPNSTDEKILRALITRDGGDKLDLDKLGL